MRAPAVVLFIAAAGAWGLAAIGLWVWWQVVHGPGDDNPMGAVGLLAGMAFGSLGLVAAVGGVLLWRAK
jgi:hypothetical protein